MTSRRTETSVRSVLGQGPGPEQAGKDLAHPVSPDCPRCPPPTLLGHEETNVRPQGDAYLGTIPGDAVSEGDAHSLDQPATPRISRAALQTDVSFRHSGWQHNRDLVRAALIRTDVPAARIDRWDLCGSNAWVVRDVADPGRLAVVASYCHDRFCRPCANQRSRIIVGNLLPRLSKKHHRFLTFTIKDDVLSLRELVDKLYRCFRRVRASKLCKKRLRGGVAFLEIKWNQATDHWHPHLHVIAEGTYIPREQLIDLWKRITGDSWNVDIRTIPDTDTVGRYVSKYASKPLSNTFVNRPEQLDDAVRVLLGRRLFTTFGTWRGWRLLEVHSDTVWESIGPLAELRSLAQAGNDRAIAILIQVGARTKCQHPRAPPDSQNSESRRTA